MMSRFNPLHCGAVVASPPPGPPSAFGGWGCFNPLHCGAVVASQRHGRRPDVRRTGFNPLHCGAVVASTWFLLFPARRRARFNPLHCGAVVASNDFRDRGNGARRVSIPFIAGQWSLHESSECRPREGEMFQSPSLRGSGRFRGWGPAPGRGAGFQSPSLRGSGRFRRWLRRWMRRRPCFNPLHCGAVVASRSAGSRSAPARRVSIPFIAGQWSLPAPVRRRRMGDAGFNPLHCGAVVASGGDARRGGARVDCFNPLHCGAVVASGPPAVWQGGRGLFQSPSLRGSGRFPGT